MKKIFTLLFLLSAFTSHAQRTLFGGNNNYVAPVGPPSLASTIVLDLDAGIPRVMLVPEQRGLTYQEKGIMGLFTIL